MTITNNYEAKYEPRYEFFDLLKILTSFIIKNTKLNHILYLSAFITLGICDGVTAAFMMDKLGAGIEANPLIRHIFVTDGFIATIMAKLWFTITILSILYLITRFSSENMYWTTNAVLISLTIVGLVAMHANLSTLLGGAANAPVEIIYGYLTMVIVFMQIGSFVDKRADYAKMYHRTA